MKKLGKLWVIKELWVDGELKGRDSIKRTVYTRGTGGGGEERVVYYGGRYRALDGGVFKVEVKTLKIVKVPSAFKDWTLAKGVK